MFEKNFKEINASVIVEWISYLVIILTIIGLISLL